MARLALRFCALGILCCAGSVFAQETGGAAEAEMMKLMTPGEFHKKLAPLVGEWDVAVKFKMAKDPPEQEGKATCSAKWVLGGRFVFQEYNSIIMGEPFTVYQYLGYDNHKKEYVEIMMDSMDTGLLHNKGSISTDGRTLTNKGESVDPMTMKPSKLRTVYTFTDADHFTLEWYQTLEGGTEEKMVTLQHTRKKE